MCECYKIGGRFIAEDPDCPVHGYTAVREQEEKETEMRRLQDRVDELERQVRILNNSL